MKADRRGAALALCAAFAASCAACPPEPQELRVLRRHAAPAARQGVAVAGGAFYAVDTRVIEKYDAAGGALLSRYDAGIDAAIVHLNGCSAHAGVLYCAHSNYPGVPMQSSIERFDADTLAHLGSQPLADAPGSATWVDRDGERWLVAFAHYAGRGGEPGRGPEHSRIVAYDDAWHPLAEYSFPDALIARFAGYSSSGGALAANGVLYLTGHDARELYVACLRDAPGEVLWHSTWPVPFAGQGIAWDPRSGTLWGIERRAREVLELEIPPERQPTSWGCPAELGR